jgi:hypothetical protein
VHKFTKYLSAPPFFLEKSKRPIAKVIFLHPSPFPSPPRGEGGGEGEDNLGMIFVLFVII